MYTRKHALVAAVLFACAQIPTLHAETWGGAGGNSNWSTGANWDTAAPPANDGSAAIVMSGATDVTPNVDTAWAINSLTFANAVSSFTLGGGQLTVGAGGITNNTAVNQYVNTSLALSTPQSWTANGGTLSITGSSVNLGANTLTMTGAGATSITAPITGSGGLVYSGTGGLTLGAANTFTGGVSLLSGTISANSTMAFGTAPILLGDVSGNADVTVLFASGLTISSSWTVQSGMPVQRPCRSVTGQIPPHCPVTSRSARISS